MQRISWPANAGLHRRSKWRARLSHCYVKRHGSKIPDTFIVHWRTIHSALGAMQMTNILRDVDEDSRLDRIYLPGEDLRRFGYGEAQLFAGVVDDAVRRVDARSNCGACANFMQAPSPASRCPPARAGTRCA